MPSGYGGISEEPYLRHVSQQLFQRWTEWVLAPCSFIGCADRLHGAALLGPRIGEMRMRTYDAHTDNLNIVQA